MFENCNSLGDLNAARMKAMKDGTDPIEVNNAYNKRRTELLSMSKPFTKIEFTRLVLPEPIVYRSIPIAGESTKAGTIEFTGAGFLV